MSKITRNRVKWIVAIGLFVFLCSIWAVAPLWVNPCIPTHLSEEEIKQIHAEPSWKHLTLEQQAETDELYRDEEIPCGAQDLPVREKLGASRFQGMILDELEYMGKLILRFELVDTGEHGGTYYFKGYTFFYIPLYRVFAGGSGYLEIDRLPFETHEGIDIGKWK